MNKNVLQVNLNFSYYNLKISKIHKHRFFYTFEVKMLTMLII
ncbi:MAG: hypothetical protein ACRYE7_01900 [Janthinobacterium lividum]